MLIHIDYQAWVQTQLGAFFFFFSQAGTGSNPTVGFFFSQVTGLYYAQVQSPLLAFFSFLSSNWTVLLTGSNPTSGFLLFFFYKVTGVQTPLVAFFYFFLK